MAATEAGTTLDQRYELLAPLSDRGIGESWQARDRQHEGREVGVKLLKPLGGGATAIPRELLDHIKALRAFRHDDILSVINHGLWQTRPYLVYDLFDGCSVGSALDDARRDDKLIELALVEALFDRVCKVVHAAHRAPRPLLHLTVTPGCVLYRGAVADLTVRVVDFGLARHAATDPTAPLRSARVLGLPAPEQLAPDGKVGPHTDVFGLGGLLREMLSLPPELGMTLAPAGLERRRDDVPDGLWEVIARAMTPHASARFPTVEALREATAAAWRTAPRARPVAPKAKPAAPAEAPAAQATVDELAARAAASQAPRRVTAEAPVSLPISGPLPAPTAQRLAPLAGMFPQPSTPLAGALPTPSTPLVEAPPPPAAAFTRPAPQPAPSFPTDEADDLGATIQVASRGFDASDAAPLGADTHRPRPHFEVNDTQELDEATGVLSTTMAVEESAPGPGERTRVAGDALLHRFAPEASTADKLARTMAVDEAQPEEDVADRLARTVAVDPSALQKASAAPPHAPAATPAFTSQTPVRAPPAQPTPLPKLPTAPVPVATPPSPDQSARYKLIVAIGILFIPVLLGLLLLSRGRH